MTLELKTRAEKRRWKRAYEWALEHGTDGKGFKLTGREAAGHADGIILQYRIRGLQP